MPIPLNDMYFHYQPWGFHISAQGCYKCSLCADLESLTHFKPSDSIGHFYWNTRLPRFKSMASVPTCVFQKKKVMNFTNLRGPTSASQSAIHHQVLLLIPCTVMVKTSRYTIWYGSRNTFSTNLLPKATVKSEWWSNHIPHLTSSPLTPLGFVQT